ncbi:MAG: hypothetical protein HRT66_09875 [Flavobacteriaceae bacterium]|nr:hypothetical protein [Flavobacteriaceae bacterium]
MKKISLVAFFVSFSLFSQENLKTKHISVYSNGLNYIHKQGEFKTVNKNISIDYGLNMNPIEGSFMVDAKANSVVKLKAESKDIIKIEENNKILSIPYLISNNIGKKASVYIDKDTYTGTINSVVQKNKTLKLLYLVTKEDEWVVLPIEDIKRVVFSEKPNELNKSKDSIKTLKKRLNIVLKKDNPKQILDLYYLHKGIAWVPSYLLELTNSRTAKLTMKATVVNDLEDIKNTDIELVVGSPVFSQENRNSSLFDFKQRVISNNYSYKSRSVKYELEDDLEEVVISSYRGKSNKESTQIDDLYFYKLNNQTIKKGARVNLDIFAVNINYKHIYECKVPVNEEYLRTNLSKNKTSVYHKIEIENKSKQVFAKAPAMVLKTVKGEVKTLAQNTLSYTPKNGKSTITISKDNNIEVLHKEIIISKTRVKGAKWNFVTIAEGTVYVNSYKDKTVEINIYKKILGDLTGKGTYTIVSQKQKAYSYNLSSTIKWNINLASKAKKEFKYSYKIYTER